jgi:hypothetical protein
MLRRPAVARPAAGRPAKKASKKARAAAQESDGDEEDEEEIVNDEGHEDAEQHEDAKEHEDAEEHEHAEPATEVADKPCASAAVRYRPAAAVAQVAGLGDFSLETVRASDAFKPVHVTDHTVKLQVGLQRNRAIIQLMRLVPIFCGLALCFLV